MKPIKFGTRGSKLAIAQTTQIVEYIKSLNPGLQTEIITIKTTGDKTQDVSFSQVGTKGMFVKEIEEALFDGTIDVGVHSAKDLPSEIIPGLTIGAYPKRIDPRDALLLLRPEIQDIPTNAVIGTSSARRKIQMNRAYPNFQIRELRGNLDTRYRRLSDGDYDGIILACAGLIRLGWEDKITQRLPLDTFIPAPGQGALALEVCETNCSILDMLGYIDDKSTRISVSMEREFQNILGMGCDNPLGAYCEISEETITLRAMIADGENDDYFETVISSKLEENINLGKEAATSILERRGY